jgi:alpha-beta hydrolase superfamily lysophospholipase
MSGAAGEVRRVVTADGLSLSSYSWSPAPSGLGLVIAPGFSEYGERYAEVARFLGERGIAVVTYDPRGHGRSEGVRGHSPRWKALVGDLDHVIAGALAAGALPARWALLGASMGALVALDWAIARPEHAQALVLVAPFFRYGSRAPVWRVALAHAASAVAPTLAQPHGLRGAQLTTDPELSSLYDRDPRINRVMSARYYVEYRATQERLLASTVPGRYPILVLHGEDDRIADPAPSRAFVSALSADRVTSYFYPCMRHEVLNERERERVYHDLAKWLERALPT